MLFAGMVGIAFISDDSEAEMSSVSHTTFTIDDEQVTSYRIGTGESFKVSIGFYEYATVNSLTVSYEVALLDDDGDKVTGATTRENGTLTMSGGKGSISLTVNSQSKAGNYTLEFKTTETGTYSDGTEINNVERVGKLPVKIVEPVTLTVTLENTSNVNIADLGVYFYIDGNKIDGSLKTVDIEAGKTSEVTFDYTGELKSGKHTFYVESSSANSNVSGLGEACSSTFYYDQGDYDYLNYIMGILLVVFIILCIWVFRKPVKNYGKPKARR